MPPRRPAIRRPAARARVPRAGPRLEVVKDQWLRIEDHPMEGVNIGDKLKMKMKYGEATGETIGEVMEFTMDQLGNWVGLDVQGTTFPALRHWKLSRGAGAGRLFCSRGPVEAEHRLQEDGIGYPLEVMILGSEPREAWAHNCKDAAGPDENADLRAAAGALGFPQGLDGEVPPRPGAGGAATAVDVAEVETARAKSSKRKRVREMVQKAKWDPKGTPLDPAYKREISVSLKKRKKEASSSASSSSESSGSYGGIGREQELKAVSRKLPGYLTRKAAQEGATALSQEIGEDLKGYQMFLRYYRQVVVPRGGSKPILRELLTLATALDSLIAGNVLSTLDLLSQRFKSLELLQGGADGEVARQLELVPPESIGLASSAESRFAQAEHSAEQKMRRGLAKGGFQQWGTKGTPKGETPGSWKGSDKGDKGKGKGKGKQSKGKKGEESKVVTVEPGS